MYPKSKNNDRHRHTFIAKVRAAIHAWESLNKAAGSSMEAMEKISAAMKELDSIKPEKKNA